MVLLGGLEIVAAGYLLNELNQNRIDDRNKKKRKHDRPSSSHHRPSSSRPPGEQDSSHSLMPPARPPRPSSAPPVPAPMPQGSWQHPQQYAPQYPNPAPQWQQQQPRPQPPQPPQQQYYQQPPPPGPIQHRPTFPPQQQSSPNPGISRPNTFPVHQSSPNLPPQPPQITVNKPPPSGPLMYYNMRTGKYQHNMYPPDHPMARDLIGVDNDGLGRSRELYQDGQYAESQPANLDGYGSQKGREDDLAYEKEYLRRGRSSSFR